MPPSKSNYLRGQMYKAAFRNTAFQGAAQLYFSMHSGAPGLIGVSELTGVNAPGYTRTPFSMGADVNGAGASSTAATFPTPTANWIQATHWGIWDAAVGGNFYGGDFLFAPITASTGVPVTFPAGNITWAET